MSGWGSGFSINGHYHSEDISTQRTEVANGLNLSVHLDGIDMGIGEVGYIVTPYAYWAKNGALVIDYAAKPELAAPGATPTWWQANYEKYADPAFILPWHYDPEKGFALQEEAKRYQTKDIIFYPQDPKAGDVVTIEAHVHNFSLIPTPDLVGIKFYVGDPSDGGTLIEDVNGASEVFTNEAIAARGTEVVHFRWQIPDSLGAFPRIYALIDAEEQLQEIHENNNKAWAVLQKSTATSIAVKEDNGVPKNFSLLQNYPNPFNPSTTIRFSLSRAEHVTLKVFDIIGREVVTLLDDQLPVGNHSVVFAAKRLTSGVYFYRLTAGQFTQIRKAILMK